MTTSICSMDVGKTFTKRHNFFVTGLPRSRTAWFSEFLPNCYHECMEGCYTHADYLHKLVAGDSSSMLAFFPIRRYFPDAPLLIIERDLGDVIESLDKIDLFNADVLLMLEESERRLNEMSGLRMDFHDIDLREAWGHLIGDGFDEDRTRVFDMKNIQKVNKYPDIPAFNSFIGET